MTHSRKDSECQYGHVVLIRLISLRHALVSKQQAVPDALARLQPQDRPVTGAPAVRGLRPVSLDLGVRPTA